MQQGAQQGPQETPERHHQEGQQEKPSNGSNTTQQQTRPARHVCITDSRGEYGPDRSPESRLPGDKPNNLLAGARVDVGGIKQESADTKPAPRRKRRVRKPGRPPKPRSRYISSTGFRDRIFNAYPALNNNRGYAMLMEHLLFNRHRPEEQPFLIDHGLLASFNDESYEHFSSGAFLEAFQREVLPGFEWSEYDYAQGLAREVERVGLPGWLEDALVSELATPPNEADSLYFATGRKYDPSADRTYLNREARAEAVRLTADKILVVDQKLLLDYHHALPSNSFTTLIQKGLDGALATVKNIKNAAARAQTSAVLRRLQGASVPYYTAVHNSYRLYQPVAGLQQLKREVRASLMHGCIDLDADALHIAIMAKRWGVHELQALLQDHGAKGFWRELTTFMAGRPLRHAEQKVWKGVLKHGVYALGYGGGEAKIAEQIQAYDETGVVRSHFGSYEKVVARMKAMPEMDALFKAKDYWVRRISEKGGMRGAYEWVPLRKTRMGQPGRNPLTVLAMVSSSYELSLMASIYPVAKQYADDVKILLYQFDGVTLKFHTRKEHQRQNILAQMHAAFDARAKELGIITGLKTEWM